jgi:hypothetical protein
MMSPIESLRGGAQQPFHPEGKVWLWRFQNQVKVICHQTIRMDLPPGFQTGTAKRVQKIKPVLIAEEDGFALISAAEHMIERTCVLYPEGTGHARTLARKSITGQGGASESPHAEPVSLNSYFELFRRMGE